MSMPRLKATTQPHLARRLICVAMALGIALCACTADTRIVESRFHNADRSAAIVLRQTMRGGAAGSISGEFLLEGRGALAQRTALVADYLTLHDVSVRWLALDRVQLCVAGEFLYAASGVDYTINDEIKTIHIEVACP
ncbi:MAG: hypothetical protein NW203_00870 [Hyphomonadaceae bacterium]|nr:hypothetical protein [Hyphomonadaceae bacterium]